MNVLELKYFEELKKEVTATFQKSHPNCNSRICDWKGQDITDFQEDLINKVHGRISEKWFYTHIKSPALKLPRIDMLNMLSEYAGYKNWNDFLGINNFSLNNNLSSSESNESKTELQEPANEKKSTTKSKTAIKWSRVIFWLSAICVFGILIKVFTSNTHKYTCCFVDIDGHTPIKSKIRVTVLMEGESPVYSESNTNGCLELQEQNDKIKFVINTPYFHPDTFARILNKEIMEEKIQLKTDDYAIMIHYFSKSNIKDWAKRRLQLNDMISDNAKIFQVYRSEDGMELYNKKEFIDKLTIPLKSLRTVEILDIKYSGIRISELRFTQTLDK